MYKVMLYSKQFNNCVRLEFINIKYTMNFDKARMRMALNPIILMFVDIDDAKSSSLNDNIICT